VAYRDYIFLVPSVEEKTHYFKDNYPKPKGDTKLSSKWRDR